MAFAAIKQTFQFFTTEQGKILSPLERLLLLTLGNRTNTMTLQCNPSIKKLQKDTGISITSLHRIIKSLIEKDIINVYIAKKETYNASNIYELKYIDMTKIPNYNPMKDYRTKMNKYIIGKKGGKSSSK